MYDISLYMCIYIYIYMYSGPVDIQGIPLTYKGALK